MSVSDGIWKYLQHTLLLHANYKPICTVITWVTRTPLFFLLTGLTLECFRCDLGFWDLCFTTKTNCSEDELCYVGIGKAGKCGANDHLDKPSPFGTLANFLSGFSASVLDIKVMGCLPMEDCNKTTVVEFLGNKTFYTMNSTCCEEDFCNSGPAVQLSLAPLLLTVLVIAQIMGVF